MNKRGKKKSLKTLPTPKVDDAHCARDNQYTGLEEDNSASSTPPLACRASLEHHLAVRLGDCIVLWSCPTFIWTYSLWIEGWIMYAVPQREELSSGLPSVYCGTCSAVAIGSDVYVFGPGITPDSMNSLLCKLTRRPDGSFEWSIGHDDNFKKWCLHQEYAIVLGNIDRKCGFLVG